MSGTFSDSFAGPGEAFRAGVLAVIPFVAGTIPFGLVTGIATKAAGLAPLEAAAMTVIVFAGTAQLAALPLMVAGAPPALVIVTAFIVNLRFVIYSAAVAPHFRHLPLRWKFLLGYFVTDTGFAVFMRKAADRPGLPQSKWFFLGAGAMVAAVWLLSALVGIVAGAHFPAAWKLEFAATLAILALLAPFVRDKPEFAAAVTGGVVALAAISFPLKLGLVCGALAGMAAGALMERALAEAKP